MVMIFIDTGAFIALSMPCDQYHARADATYSQLIGQHQRLVTTNHVVDETCTGLLRKAVNGHQAALRFGRSIARAAAVTEPAVRSSFNVAPRTLVVLYATPALERAAWDIFARHDSAGFSFTDCVSFAVMQSLAIKKAFTFDKHYDTMGFERL